MARVFLSHASPDKPAVRRIATALRAAGHDTWLDEDDMLVGESIPAAIERGLRDTDFVVLCLSNAAAERGWVEAERDATLMQQFRERRERILPVRLEDVAPPYLLRPLAYVDLFPDEQGFTQGIARLMRSIEAHQARHARTVRPPESATPSTPPSPGPTTEPRTAAPKLPATVPPRSDDGGTNLGTPLATNSRAVKSLIAVMPVLLAGTALLWIFWPNGPDRLDVAGVAKELTVLAARDHQSPQSKTRRRTELGSGAYLLDEPLGQGHLSIAYVAPPDTGPALADLGWAQGDVIRVAREWRFVASLTVATFGRNLNNGSPQSCRLFARGTGVECGQRIPLQVIISSGAVLRAQPSTRSTSAISAICIDRAQMWRVVLAIPKDASKQPSDMQTSLFYEHLLRNQECLDAAEIQTGEPVQMVLRDERSNHFTIPEGISQGVGRDLIVGLRWER